LAVFRLFFTEGLAFFENMNMAILNPSV